jgi:hypothetical protein
LESVPAVVYLLGVMLQMLPLLVLTSFAPAILAGSFFFLTFKGSTPAAFVNGLLGFMAAFGVIAVAMGMGAYHIGWSAAPRSDTDVVQFAMLYFFVHSVTFWLVGGWIVRSMWNVSRVGAALLAAGMIAGELTLLLADGFGHAALRPRAAIVHVIVYTVLVFAVVRLQAKQPSAHSSEPM